MKRIILACLLVLGLTILSWAGIRGTEWGMYKEQVRKIEKSKLIEETDQSLCYKIEIGGRDE